MARKIKTGDTVYVITGDAKGNKGRVMNVNTKTLRVIVEGVNVRSKHEKPSMKNPDGGIVKKEQSIHISNVAIADPDVQENLQWSKRLTSRVGFRFQDDGKKVRYAKRSQKDLG